jgi:hypothetical protein
MAVTCRGLAALLIVAFALVWAGCSTVNGESTDDSEIISALNLKQMGNGYEMNGDPFCRIDDLLNDVDEVNAANKKKGTGFVIAAPKGQAGVVAHPPFAPSCKHQAEDELKQLVKPSKKSSSNKKKD